MPTSESPAEARPTYDDLKGELRERIADLEEELEGGREETGWGARHGMQGEPAYRHRGEAYGLTADLLETRRGDLVDLQEREERGEGPPIPDWW